MEFSRNFRKIQIITPNDCILHKIREKLTSFAPKNEGKESQISFNLRRVFVLICFNLPISIPARGDPLPDEDEAGNGRRARGGFTGGRDSP